MKRLRSKVREGLRELQEKRYLEAYEITRDHRVVVTKSRDTAVNFEGQILGKTGMSYLAD